MTDEEREQVVLAPVAEAYQTLEWITRLAAERLFGRIRVESDRWVAFRSHYCFSELRSLKA